MVYQIIGILFIITILASLPILITNFLYYGIFVSPLYFLERPLIPNVLPYRTSSLVVGLAYILSLLRLPFIVMPYLGKVLVFLLLRGNIKGIWSAYPVQILRLLGDFANFLITFTLLLFIFAPLENPYLLWFIGVVGMSELIRLVTEKGQTTFSGCWQTIPHQKLARIISQRSRGRGGNSLFGRYAAYYHLSPSERAEILLQVAHGIHRDKSDVARKLSYANHFRIVPQGVGLRSGNVRDVARGEIFIHEAWTNDPWLMMGQFFRRSLWIFDPRLMKRPFFYRTETNRLMTHFVLKNSRYAFPYCWYQFGQEIKVARYDIFFRVMRRVGFNLEKPVRADGSYAFDPFLGWLGKQLGFDGGMENKPKMWGDEEVIHHLISCCDGQDLPTDQEIASRFAYPLLYVQEILRPRLTSHLSDKS